MKAVWVGDSEMPLGQGWTAPYVCHSSERLVVARTEIYMDLNVLFESLKDSQQLRASNTEVRFLL